MHSFIITWIVETYGDNPRNKNKYFHDYLHELAHHLYFENKWMFPQQTVVNGWLWI